MDQHTLKAESRDLIAKRHGKRLRREGKVPAVLYGGEGEPVNLTVDDHEMELILRGAYRSNAIFNLSVGDGKQETTIIRDMQRHPVKSNLVHLDFQRVDVNKPIDVEMPIHETGGKPAGVRAGGVLEHITRTVNIRCTPLNLPSSIDIDISALEMNESVHVSDLKLPEGVEILDDPDTPICAIVAPGGGESKSTEEEGEVEGAESEEGDEE